MSENSNNSNNNSNNASVGVNNTNTSVTESENSVDFYGLADNLSKTLNAPENATKEMLENVKAQKEALNNIVAKYKQLEAENKEILENYRQIINNPQNLFINKYSDKKNIINVKASEENAPKKVYESLKDLYKKESSDFIYTFIDDRLNKFEELKKSDKINNNNGE